MTDPSIRDYRTLHGSFWIKNQAVLLGNFYENRAKGLICQYWTTTLGKARSGYKTLCNHLGF
jgi:hypothetical protein